MDLRIRQFVKILAIAALLAGAAHAQFLGYVSSQTTAQSAFTNQSANGITAAFNNIGQTAHYLTYCPSSFVGTLTLEASVDGTFGSPITIATANFSSPNFVQATSTCRVVPAAGYYPAVRARITNYTSGSITAFYTGVAAPANVTQTALNSHGATTPVQCDQTQTQSVAFNVESTLVFHSTLQTIFICSMTFGLAAAPTGNGVLSLATGTNGGLACSTNFTTIWQIPLLTTTPLQPFFFGGSFGAWLVIPPGQDICIGSTAASATNFLVTVTYAQGFSFP